VALFEASSHLVALLVRLRAEVYIVFIKLIRLVPVLQTDSLGVICTVREPSTNYEDLLGIVDGQDIVLGRFVRQCPA